MASVIKFVKDRLATYRMRRNQKLFIRLMKNPKSGMSDTIQAEAYKMATTMTMRIMDAEGFSHCALCFSRKQLKYGPSRTLLCPYHFPLDQQPSNPKKETENNATQTRQPEAAAV